MQMSEDYTTNKGGGYKTQWEVAVSWGAEEAFLCVVWRSGFTHKGRQEGCSQK